VLIVNIALFSCQSSESDNKQEEQKTNIIGTEYEKYLVLEPDSINNKVTLEQKFTKADSLLINPPNLTELTVLRTDLLEIFEQTGKVKALNTATQLQEKVADITAIKKEKQLRYLAQLYIKQHRFKDAKIALDKAVTISDTKQNKYVAFDISMELGDYSEAKKLIGEIAQDNDYNYLIRLAKWKDHEGNLDRTIEVMHKAEKLAEASGNPLLNVWMYSNLGDYYGHNNQLDLSYEYYLKTLELDNKNFYTLRKIAYILYAHQGEYDKALKIIDYLQKHNPTPDLSLFEAEIYAVSNQEAKYKEAINQFITKVENDSYGDMYNGYLVPVYIREGQAEKALIIANKEVQNRSTPESYSLLASAQLANNQKTEALETIQTKVLDKTYEPKTLLVAARVLKANEKFEEVKPIKEELEGAAFEMGPFLMQEIKAL
jgi:tetratricopeptide (TPR) repeat protein